MFKKIYVEITNSCNLNCSFCIGHTRKKEFITIDKFKLLLDKIKNHTDYLYFHLMGEPLIHPYINDLIDIASNNFNINITTNGYFIDRIKDNKHIRQINISLHSYDETKNKTLDEYLNNIFESVEILSNNTYISYRMWTNNKYKDEIIKHIEDYYDIKIDGHTKIKENVFFDFDTEFIWPDLNNDYYNENGSCQGLSSHVGILLDGSVVPCCLDYNANLLLGNIYEDSLDNILKSERAVNMFNSFKNKIKCEEFCKHCNFYDRIRTKKAGDIDE
jgi:radical SAM protein with 4Fe4S-binding SPASM domain